MNSRKSNVSRRNFLQHTASATATLPVFNFLTHLDANAASVRKKQKSCILVWLNGAAPTIDMWDLKPGSSNAGEFKPISTKGDFQICEHLPKLAKQADNFSLIRSMNTREADHNRGRYYLHTSFVPSGSVDYPVFGSMVSKDIGSKRSHLEIPSFISIDGNIGGAGFLGMAHSQFVINNRGQIQNSAMGDVQPQRLQKRLKMLGVVESRFIKSKRGIAGQAHKDIYTNAVNLMTSSQLKVFQVNDEPKSVKSEYGETNLGRGLLIARRLAQLGVPFIEVVMNGWDLHANLFNTAKDQMLPTVDQAMSALFADLKSKGMLDSTAVICMGEFGRTPRINGNSGRDHWAKSWSVMLGGCGMTSGIAVGETNSDGTEVIGKSHLPGDVWATIAKAIGLPNKDYQSRRGQQVRFLNGGTPISELI
jgi:uncharacterized protein (DUF1501 family)